MSDTLTRQLEESVIVAQAQRAAENPVGLRQKLFCVMKEVSYLQKDKKNDHFGYRYASEAAIKAAFHAAFVKYGILFWCDPIEYVERTGLGKDGRETLIICKFAYGFQDVETGETREGITHGSGTDSGDKHLYKAITGAAKFLLTSTFLVASGDDPENEQQTKEEKKAAAKTVAETKIAAAGGPQPVEPRPANAITDGQRKRMYAISKESGKPHDVVKIILAEWGFASSKDVTADKYDEIIKSIQKPLRIIDVSDGSDMPDPFEVPNDAYVRAGGKLFRVNDTQNAYTEMK